MLPTPEVTTWARTGHCGALMMAAASNIMMTLTHYATGTSPVIFGSGYTTLGEWWKTGFVMSVLLIVIWLVVGGAWWRLLGYW